MSFLLARQQPGNGGLDVPPFGGGPEPFPKLAAVRSGRSAGHAGLATGTGLEQAGLPGIRASPPAQTAQWAAPEHGGAQSGAGRGRVVGDYGGGGSAGAASLPVQRPAGKGNPEPEARGGGLGRLPPELDGSEPRYYLSNAPEDTPLETLAYVGGSRWRVETEFETENSDVELDEYETRTWAGWHHHVALCLLGGAFLLSLQQAWGEKDAPDHETAGLPSGSGDSAPGAVRAG